MNKNKYSTIRMVESSPITNGGLLTEWYINAGLKVWDLDAFQTNFFLGFEYWIKSLYSDHHLPPILNSVNQMQWGSD